MPGVYATKVSAMGYAGSPRTDIYGRDGQNYYDNPFGNETMLVQLSNGGIMRISENRCVGWMSPETYISQFYGTDGGYEFSVAKHHQSHWDPERPGKVIMKDVTSELQSPAIAWFIKNDFNTAIQQIGNAKGLSEDHKTSETPEVNKPAPVQPTWRLPKEFEGLKNGHGGTHQFMIDDFCRAYATGKLSPTNIWTAARYNIPGLIAHESAMAGGKLMDIPDLGDPPADWEVLDFDS